MPKAGFRRVTLPDDLYNVLDVNAQYNKTSISKYIDSLVRMQNEQLLTLCSARSSGVQVPLSSPSTNGVFLGNGASGGMKEVTTMNMN